MTQETASYCPKCQAFHGADDHCLGAAPRFKEDLLDCGEMTQGKRLRLRVGEVMHADDATLEYLYFLYSAPAVKRRDGVWRSGSGLGAEVSSPDDLLSKVPEGLKRSATQIDWDRWAAEAWFDKQDRVVLQHRLTEISRDRALAQQRDEQSRKALQAAWRKFDRCGVERLRKAAEKFKNNKLSALPSKMSRRRPK